MIKQTIKTLRMLFMRPNERGELEVVDVLHKEFIGLLYQALNLMVRESSNNGTLDCEDYLNLLADKYYQNGFAFEEVLLESIFELIVNKSGIDSLDSEEGDFVLAKAEIIFAGLREFAGKIQKSSQDNLNLYAKKLLNEMFNYSTIELKNKLKQCDPFLNCRTFLYRDGAFFAIKVERYCQEFFGYEGVRTIYNDHFGQFAHNSNVNVPLLISSLPGHGKTQMTIYNALKYENLTLIFAEPATITEDLPKLIKQLSMRKDRKFVLFFDDIVPDDVDWYYFKNYVGGSFMLPDNILIVLASNYHFGASLLSRGRSVVFPIFDEIRCMEMVEGFLMSCHLQHPRQNLISMIAADYTEHFGQKRFSELSPRTLMRYLEIYKTNINKRKTMMNLSMGDLITKPDASLFYDFNINLMRKLYGNEFIENLLKEKLRELER